jgi:ribosomal protein S12 methylthiotransferase
LPGALPDEVREERRARFMEVQAKISREKLRAKVGRTFEVLVDKVEGTKAIARSSADAPEIDGIVTVKSAKGALPGDLMRVKITAAGDHDLVASRVN